MQDEILYTISKDHTRQASQTEDLSLLLPEKPATGAPDKEERRSDQESSSILRADPTQGDREHSQERTAVSAAIERQLTDSDVESSTSRPNRFLRRRENRSRAPSPASGRFNYYKRDDRTSQVSSPESHLRTATPMRIMESAREDMNTLFGDSSLQRRTTEAAPTGVKRRIDSTAILFENHPKRPDHGMVSRNIFSKTADMIAGDPADAKALDQRISELRSEIKALEELRRQQIPQEWRVIYRVYRTQPKDTSSSGAKVVAYHYLDQPRWYGGIEQHEPLAGTEPILDMDSYLDRHSELAFVVFRDYGKERHDGSHFSTVGEAHYRSPEEGYPLPFKESTIFIYPELVDAVDRFLQLLPSNNGISFPHEKTWPRELQAPYLAIYHYWEKFNSVLDWVPERARRPWKMFVDYIEKGFSSEYSQVDSQFQQGLVCPRFMKYLIKPGDILYFPGHAVVEAVQVVSQLHKSESQYVDNVISQDWQGMENENDIPVVEFRQRSRRRLLWPIEVIFWSFDISFKRERQRQILDMFVDVDEKIPIVSLPLYPLQFASPCIKRRILDRGISLWKCRNRRYVEYSKDAEIYAWSSVKSRYMIDPVTYQRMHGNKVPEEALLSLSDLSAQVLQKDQCPDYPFPMLLPRTVRGYNFTEKIWVDLEVDHISDVQWNTQAFKSLVTDEQTKDLLEALVKNQLSIETSTDLIAGKGNGLIILLHGGPGTGKTYTAESVADYARKPLYRVTCGDIGTKPVDVEKYLETVLRLGRTWGCVVLLDEADIFLEERTLSDLDRNALVSVFLRVLEYYNGILILTSNRVGHFDEAFRSRIQLALHYESLSREQRHQIWSNFIKHLHNSDSCKMDFDDLVLHINDLSMYEMNGRQIRNAITTSRQLAEFKKKDLNYDIIKKVIGVTGRFDRYLQSVKQLETVKEGTLDDTIAREAGMR
ncbi:hypothetical protein ASPFODRAFT_52314 [Aspergillus luchuensis CBS 106.47]|uniref:AAA+ ATPase domain-containing protein n=1 Tax=Aspergillus luchuensis (strain CBS 106.47) TaxID=1137211 RepID=A0A1M3T3D1_ASPLC|nr:hypothetical protein ASPFODRAFT_52314 [Aspergillus luchuensis CBS 106.47]